jgi:hypothetical protein
MMAHRTWRLAMMGSGGMVLSGNGTFCFLSSVFDLFLQFATHRFMKTKKKQIPVVVPILFFP